MFKVILWPFLFSYHLSGAEYDPDKPNRAGTIEQVETPGIYLMQAIDRMRQDERDKKEENKSGWFPQRKTLVIPRAGTLPNPCHRPDHHPHRGHSHKGLPNPYSVKKH